MCWSRPTASITSRPRPSRSPSADVEAKMADPMKIRATLVGDSTEVKVLMSHEMETGQRKDAQGAVIPAWFIQNVTVAHGGTTVLAAPWGPAVSEEHMLSSQ